jgi:acetyltransferase
LRIWLGAAPGRAVVITAFPPRQPGTAGDLKQAMLVAARPALLRILGPNGIGVLVPHVGLNASFSHLNAKPGELAFVAQSGASGHALLDWAEPRGIGFSHVVSMCDHGRCRFRRHAGYLAADTRTRAILLYIEAIRMPAKFMSAARIAARYQAGHRHQGRSLCRRRAGGGFAYRRARRRRRGL